MDPTLCLYIFSCCNHNFHIYPKDQNNPTRGVFCHLKGWSWVDTGRSDGVWKLKTGLARLCVSPTTRGHASLDPHPHPPRISLHSSTDSPPPFSPDNFYLVLLKNIVRFCCHVHMGFSEFETYALHIAHSVRRLGAFRKTTLLYQDAWRVYIIKNNNKVLVLPKS